MGTAPHNLMMKVILVILTMSSTQSSDGAGGSIHRFDKSINSTFEKYQRKLSVCPPLVRGFVIVRVGVAKTFLVFEPPASDLEEPHPLKFRWEHSRNLRSQPSRMIGIGLALDKLLRLHCTSRQHSDIRHVPNSLLLAGGWDSIPSQLRSTWNLSHPLSLPVAALRGGFYRKAKGAAEAPGSEVSSSQRMPPRRGDHVGVTGARRGRPRRTAHLPPTSVTRLRGLSCASTSTSGAVVAAASEPAGVHAIAAGPVSPPRGRPRRGGGGPLGARDGAEDREAAAAAAGAETIAVGEVSGAGLDAVAASAAPEARIPLLSTDSAPAAAAGAGVSQYEAQGVESGAEVAAGAAGGAVALAGEKSTGGLLLRGAETPAAAMRGDSTAPTTTAGTG